MKTFLIVILVFCLLILYKLFCKNSKQLSNGPKIFLIVLSFYFVVFIICLSSRITTLALLLLLFVATYNFFLKQSLSKRLIIPFIASTFFLMLIFINPVSRYRNYQEPMCITYPTPHSKPSTLSITIRASLWWLSLKSLEDINLFLGFYW